MAAILKMLHHSWNMTLSMDWYFLEEQSCQISSRSDLNRWSLRLFWRGCPNKKNNNNMSSDMRSVPDLKSNRYWVILIIYVPLMMVTTTARNILWVWYLIFITVGSVTRTRHVASPTLRASYFFWGGGNILGQLLTLLLDFWEQSTFFDSQTLMVELQGWPGLLA